MRKTIETGLIVWGIMFLLSSCATANKYPTYQDALNNWTSYHDVASWLNTHFNFSWSRVSHAQKEGLVRKPENLYDIRKGYCIDAALFAKRSLNKIDPDYKAQLIYIDNIQANENDHWVTGFYDKDQLYVMDYGAGIGWNSMNGVHGPYESLDQYHGFLSSLRISTFTVGRVMWRDLPYKFNED